MASVEEARAALAEAEAKLAAATTTRERIAASKEAAEARKELTAANAVARTAAAEARAQAAADAAKKADEDAAAKAAANAATAKAAADAAAKANPDRIPTGQEMAAQLKGVRPIIGGGESPDVVGGAGFGGYFNYKPIDEAGKMALYGYNPSTGKAFTPEEIKAVNAGYLYGEDQGGAVGYEIDPRTGNLNVLYASGMVATTGARYQYSQTGGVVPILSDTWTAFRYDDQGRPINAEGKPITAEDIRRYNELVAQDPEKAREFAQGKGILTSSDTPKFSGSGTTGNPLILNGVPFSGSYNGAIYSNGVLKTDSTGNMGGPTTGNGTASNPLLVNGMPFNGLLGGVNYVNGVASAAKPLTESDIETKARRTAQQDFKASLSELGLGDLADEIDRMIKLDYTVSQIKMELPKTESYIQRFPGMAALRSAGQAISEATYIANERGYLQTLRAYGLDTQTLGSRTALGGYIASGVSPREFEERVNIAATRVNENPDVMAAFKSFYPEIDKAGVTAYLLNPKLGMDIIRKQIRVSEIGAAAANAGFGTNIVGVTQASDLLGAVGDTAYSALRTEFKRAQQLAISQRRLAQIEGTQYSDLEAIGAVVARDIEKGLASERRAAREVARFGQRGGLTAGSLRGSEIQI